MITDKDIEKLKQVFVTKVELKDLLNDLKNTVIKFKDEILAEITKLREDSTIDTGGVIRLKITKLA